MENVRSGGLMADLKIKQKNYSALEIRCEPSVASELTDYFSFETPGYKYMPAYKSGRWDGKTRLFNNRNNELPVGLWDYLLDFAKPRNYTLDVQSNDDYGAPNQKVDINPKQVYEFIQQLHLPFEVRDYQFDAIFQALQSKRVILLSPTGSGKSLIIYVLMMWYLEHYNKRILIVVPTTGLVQQMYADFESYGLEASLVVHRIYAGMPKNDIPQRVFVSTWQSIYQLPSAWFQQFGCVFGDEVHGFKAKSLAGIMNKSREAEYRFGLTGTLDGTQTHKLVLEGLFGRVFKVTTTKKLIDNDTLAKLKIHMLILKHPREVCKDVINTKDYHYEIDHIVGNEKRNRLIQNLALDQKGNTLVLFQYVEKHGKVIYDLINVKAKNDRKVFFVSGEVDSQVREEIRGIVEKEKDSIIVASLGTFSTGVNIRNLHNIIFASPSKSQVKVLQSIGRGLRKSEDGRETTLYDIADDMHHNKTKNYTLLHAIERMKIYKREKFDYEIHEVTL
jgi:superfamily II DNA or RNA helicase